MKYLTRALFLFALATSLPSAAAYITRGFHTTCAVDERVAKFFAKPRAESDAESTARRKCRDIALVAHHLYVKTICKEPYANKTRKNIFTHICVDCEAEAQFDCH